MAAERLGYPTQKPLALLERIIQASSNPGDWVLDPFCGCGTSIALRGTIGREKAAIGVFITLEPPSKEMEVEANAIGFYHSPGWDRDYPRLQILTIAELFGGATVQMPPTSVTFKQAEKVKSQESVQKPLF
jgi:hypothetical protein